MSSKKDYSHGCLAMKLSLYIIRFGNKFARKVEI